MLPAVPEEDRDNAANATAPVTPPTNQRFGSTDLCAMDAMQQMVGDDISPHQTHRSTRGAHNLFSTENRGF